MNPQGDFDDTSSCVSEKSISGFQDNQNSPPVSAEAKAAAEEEVMAAKPAKIKTEDGEIVIGPLVAKSKVLGAKLSDYELNLYEYSTFSLSEEVDIFYCKNKQKEVLGDDVDYDEDSLTEKC